MKSDLIERLRAHPDMTVVRHWEDWAQEADTLMREAADRIAVLETEAVKHERALLTVQNAAKTLASARGTELEHLRQNHAFDHKLRAEHDSLIERDALMTDALLKAEARIAALEAEASEGVRRGLERALELTKFEAEAWGHVDGSSARVAAAKIERALALIPEAPVREGE